MCIAKRRINHEVNLPTFTDLSLNLSCLRVVLVLTDVLVRVFVVMGCDSKELLIDGSV